MWSWMRSMLLVCLVPLFLGLAGASAVAAPTTTASPAGALFNAAQSVTLTCDGGSGPGCANTYYSTDGSTPAAAMTIVDAAYGTPFSYDPITHTFARNTPQCTASSTSMSYTQNVCNGRHACSVLADNTVFGDPCVGTYKRLYVVYQCSGQYFFVSADQHSYANLSCPGTLYSGPISIGANTTLKFRSTDIAASSESARTETYAFDFAAPTTTPSIAGGYYASAQNVALSCSDSGAGCQTTYYCLAAGCTPTTVYTASVALTAFTLLRYYSVDGLGNAEAVKQTEYLIASPAVINLTPSSLDAGSLQVGAAGIAQAVVLTNSGGLDLATPSIPGAAGDFAVSHDCPASLAGGARCTVSIVFRPTQAGVRNATLTIGSQSVSLTASGTISTSSIVIDPVTPSTLYAGLDGGGVWKKVGSGNWTAATTQPTNLNVKALAITSAGTTLFAGTDGGGVFKSSNSGVDWAVCANTGGGLTNLNLRSLALTGSTLYAGTTAGVFVSDNDCANWTAMNTGMP